MENPKTSETAESDVNIIASYAYELLVREFEKSGFVGNVPDTQNLTESILLHGSQLTPTEALGVVANLEERFNSGPVYLRYKCSHLVVDGQSVISVHRTCTL